MEDKPKIERERESKKCSKKQPPTDSQEMYVLMHHNTLLFSLYKQNLIFFLSFTTNQPNKEEKTI